MRLARFLRIPPRITSLRYTSTMASNVHKSVTLPSGRETSVPTGLFMYVPFPLAAPRRPSPLTLTSRSNNEWTTASDGKTFQTIDPATGKPLLEFSHASGQDVDVAVRHARKAFKSTWGKTIAATERAARTSPSSALPPFPSLTSIPPFSALQIRRPDRTQRRPPRRTRILEQRQGRPYRARSRRGG